MALSPTRGLRGWPDSRASDLNFPLLKRWHGEPIKPDAKDAPAKAAHLLIDGPFTNQGLAGLAGLEGVRSQLPAAEAVAWRAHQAGRERRTRHSRAPPDRWPFHQPGACGVGRTRGRPISTSRC